MRASVETLHEDSRAADEKLERSYRNGRKRFQSVFEGLMQRVQAFDS